MRVLLVNKFHYRKGGSETYYFALAEGLRALGHEVFFFAMEDPKNEPCEQSKYFVSAKDYNGPTSVRQKIEAATSLIYSGEAKKKFEMLCEDVKPDVINMNLVHRQITLSILDAPYVKKNRTPVVWTAHDYIAVCPNYTMLDGRDNVCEDCVKGSCMSCLKKKCVKGSTAKSALAVAEARFLRVTGAYKKIDRIICPSRFLEEKMLDGGFPPGQLVWMPNFLTADVIEETRAAPAAGFGAPYFVFFGRLSAEKGVDVLLRAFARAGALLPEEIKLVIVGDGPERERLEGLSSKLGLDGSAEFLGYKSGLELRGLVKGALFSVIPSTWCENMPFSVVESLLAGTPVIGSDLGGVPEMVTDGETGFTFPAGDAEALAGLLVEAAGLPEGTYREMRRSGIAFAEERCSQDRYMRELVDLYNNLIEKKKES